MNLICLDCWILIFALISYLSFSLLIRISRAYYKDTYTFLFTKKAYFSQVFCSQS